MSTIFKWSAIAIVCAVLFFSASTAATLTHVIFSTGGTAGGLMVGGIPDIANGFKRGVQAAQHAGGGNNGTGLSSWTGGTANWTAQAKQKAAPKHPPATAQVSQRHHKKHSHKAMS